MCLRALESAFSWCLKKSSMMHDARTGSQLDAVSLSVSVNDRVDCTLHGGIVIYTDILVVRLHITFLYFTARNGCGAYKPVTPDISFWLVRRKTTVLKIVTLLAKSTPDLFKLTWIRPLYMIHAITSVINLGSALTLTFRQYPAIHTNYIISHCTTLQYNHNILDGYVARLRSGSQLCTKSIPYAPSP